MSAVNTISESSDACSLNKEKWIKSTCAYCGVGCGIEAKLEDRILTVRGDSSHPANYGKLCSKGLALGDTVTTQGRMLEPSIDQQACSWSDAIDAVATGFTEAIAEYGPNSVAFYVSGQLLTEDYYIANKLMKGFIGSANIDTNSRLCMSSSVAGHKRAFGSDTVPNCYEDLDHAELIVLTGSNTAWCHPVLFQRIKQAKANNPSLRIVVIDPRETDTCAIADLHLRIQPGADVALFNGLLCYLAEQNLLNTEYIAQHTQGFDEAIIEAQKDAGTPLNYLELAHTTSLPIHLLKTFFEWFGATDKAMTLYSQGVNQSSQGANKVNALLNCHLATGRIGLEGSGPLSLTGQPNAMGGREVGGLANMLAAHLDFDEDARALVSDFWQTDNIAKQPGLKAVDLFEAIDNGQIKAVWIMATNPAVSLPNSNTVKRALEKCPLVVVSDCIDDTDTGRLAHIRLPAQGWSEKSGTVTNSERRISRQTRLMEPFGKAKPDWWIMCEVAKKMGFDTAFTYRSEADIFREHALLTGINNQGAQRRAFDIDGLSKISDQEYLQLAPQQWPVSQVQTSIEHSRFFSGGGFFTPNQKAHFVPVSCLAPANDVSPDYPLILNTGRVRDQWHTMTRTGLAVGLNGHKPEPFLAINPQDARCFDLKHNDLALVNSLYGELIARVDVSDDLSIGQCFMPIHWGEVESSHGKVSLLTSSTVDPVSGQPDSKFTPVSLKPWQHCSQAAMISQQPLKANSLTNVDYWVRRRITNGYYYRFASHLKASELNDWLLQQLPENTRECHYLQFDHPKNERFRRTVIQDETITASLWVGNTLDLDDEWVMDLLQSPVSHVAKQALLSGKPNDTLLTGATICACKQVGMKTLCKAITEHNIITVDTLSNITTAGTGCGSCLPELDKILSQQLA